MNDFWQTLITTSIPALTAIATVSVGNRNTRTQLRDQWEVEAVTRRNDAERAEQRAAATAEAEAAERQRQAAEEALVRTVKIRRNALRACAEVDTHIHELFDKRTAHDFADVDRSLLARFRIALIELRWDVEANSLLADDIDKTIRDVDAAVTALSSSPNQWDSPSQNAWGRLTGLYNYISNPAND